MKKLKIGVIGAGYWGKKILEEYAELASGNEEVSVESVCDLNDENLRYSRRLFDVAHLCHDYRELLSAPEIDAVNICTPNETHYQICTDALNADKHVLLEKPMTLRASEAHELIGLAKKKGLNLSVGHIFRFNNALRKARHLIQKGYFGDLFYLDLEWSTLMDVSGRDIITDLAPHPFDILNFLTDLWPTRVTCRAKSYRSGNREEVAFIICELDDKAAAHMHLSWLMPGKTRKVRICGSQKAADIDCLSQEMSVSNGKKTRGLKVERNNTIRSELIHFLKCVRNSDAGRLYSNHTSGIVGARVIEILEATQMSLDQDKTVPIRRFGAKSKA